MLSRVTYQILPDGSIGQAKQEIITDPWEKPNCVRPMGVTFSQTPPFLNEWSHVPCNLGTIWNGESYEFMLCVASDKSLGLEYYRRKIDIERLEIWARDQEFQVDASQWWSTEQGNSWWGKNYPGIWWKIPMLHLDGKISFHIFEAHDSEGAQKKFFAGLQNEYPELQEINKNPTPEQIPEETEFFYQ